MGGDFNYTARSGFLFPIYLIKHEIPLRVFLDNFGDVIPGAQPYRHPGCISAQDVLLIRFTEIKMVTGGCCTVPCSWLQRMLTRIAIREWSSTSTSVEIFLCLSPPAKKFQWHMMTDESSYFRHAPIYFIVVYFPIFKFTAMPM